MPRGENPEFKERVGVLSMALKRKNVERKIDAEYPHLKKDYFDIEAYLTKDECFSTIWSSIEEELEGVGSKNWSEMSKNEIEAEIERYEALKSDYEERHSVSQSI